MSALARSALLVLLAAVAAGCNSPQTADATAAGAKPAAVATAPARAAPDASIMASVHALRANNIAALVANALPPPALAKFKADWSRDMNDEPVTDEERAKFSEQMTKLTAPGAEDKLFAELEPQLKQFEQQSAQQMPMLIAMGQGFVQSAIQQSKDLTEEQKKQAVGLVDATAKWAQTAKFTDPGLARQAIGVLCRTAREVNLKSLDEMRAMSYDQGMQKAGLVLASLKQVLQLYGLSLDNALDSVKAQTVSTSGDTAKVKVSYVAFGQPFSTENELTRVGNGWYSKQALEEWNKAEQREAADAAAPDEAKATAK
jgi:hypothetical protein